MEILAAGITLLLVFSAAFFLAAALISSNGQ